MSRSSRGAVPLLGLLGGGALLLYLWSWSDAWIWFDQLRDWQWAYAGVRDGTWWRRPGTDVSGFGRNGPLPMWIYGWLLWLRPAESTPILAVTLLNAGAWLLFLAWYARRRDLGTAVALAAVVGSQPFLWSWSRLGLDLSLAPALGLALLVLLAREEPTPRPFRRGLLEGLLLAALLQAHVTLLPAVVVAGVWFAWRDAHPRHLVGLLLGGALPYLPLLVVHPPHLRPAQAFGDPWQTLTTSAVYLWRVGAALAVQARAVGLPAIPYLVVGALPWLAALWALATWSRRTRGERLAAGLFWATAALLGFRERWHYHHLMHADLVVALGTWLGVRIWRQRPLALATWALLQLVLLVQVHRYVQREGWLPLANTFPLHRAGVVEWAAPVGTRMRLFGALERLGLVTPEARTHAVVGFTLPVAELGWHRFPADPTFPPLRGEPQRTWRLGPCSGEAAVPIATELCLAPAPRPTRWWARATTTNAAWSSWAGFAPPVTPEPLDRVRRAAARARPVLPPPITPLWPTPLVSFPWELTRTTTTPAELVAYDVAFPPPMSGLVQSHVAFVGPGPTTRCEVRYGYLLRATRCRTTARRLRVRATSSRRWVLWALQADR